jgi:16S rRNA (adenine1518-N6/adenine1519-N6)-dimethyltransferase
MNDKVRAKKHLGQHFLTDEHIASQIVEALLIKPEDAILEIGPGMGVLTKYFVEKKSNIKVAEIDTESVVYLQKNFAYLENRIVEGDFLRKKPEDYFTQPIHLIGNFPYNISSQIFFKVLENVNLYPQVVCMLQKEVAKRLASPPGNKEYGILSVLLQAYYKIEYLFTVHEHVFNPPPKVKSGVIRLTRNDTTSLGCNEKLFFRLIKQGFNNRRKTLRNALKCLNLATENIDDFFLSARAEQLGVEQWITLTNQADEQKKG